MAKIKTSVHHKNNPSKHKPRGVTKRQFEKVYWPYIPLLLVIGALVSLTIQTGVLKPAITSPGTRTLDYALSMNMRRLLEETNFQRIENGSKPLRLNPKLYAAAQAKADDMAAKNYWSHYTPDGQAPWVFVVQQDYGYHKLGENLATGFLNESGTIKGWMASPGHRKNLLDPDFSEVGFGVANNPNYSSAGGGPMTIIVAMYGKPLVSSETTDEPVIANSEDAPALAVLNDVKPANTDHLSPSSDSHNRSKLSAAQLALANLPFGTIATGLLLTVTAAAICLWLTRHAFAIRRTFARGETFVVKHPLLDVCLLIIAALSLLLTKTAGIVG